MKPEIKYETHTFRFPYATVIFGKVFQVPCEVLFEYCETEEGGIRLKVESLTGMSEDGTKYDMKFLTDDEDSAYSEFIVACIIANKQHWDFISGEKEWWEH